MLRLPISLISIRSSIGAAYRHISRARSATSTSRRADGSGSLISTAIFSAPSATLTCVVHNAETAVHGWHITTQLSTRTREMSEHSRPYAPHGNEEREDVRACSFH